MSPQSKKDGKPKQKPVIGITPELLDALGVSSVEEAEALISESNPPSDLPIVKKQQAAPSTLSLYETNPILKTENLPLLRKHFQGVKARIFRYLFAKGYSILDIHKACELVLYPGIRYQQVFNAHKNWQKMLEREKLQHQDPYESKEATTSYNKLSNDDQNEETDQ